MKIQNALTLWLFVFSLLPVSIISCVALYGNCILTVYAVAVCILLVIAACIVAMKCFFSPIFSFIDSIKRLKPGDYNSHLQYNGKNELGDVARAFNELIESLRSKNEHLKKRAEELSEKEMQYQFAMGLLSDLYFEADALTGHLTTDYSKWSSYFDRSAPKSYNDLLKQAGTLIHPEEYESYLNTFSRSNLQKLVASGNLSVNLDARAMGRDGEFFWCSHSMLLIPDKRAHLVRIIGYIKNIEEQRKNEDEKKIRYQKDGLTGLYTKVVAERMIEDYITGEGKGMKHALLAIDVDNFKTINDTYGHLYGDAVLKELADGLSNLFRYSDIIGRIGGDEFIVLLKHITLANLMPEKADALLGIFDNLSRSRDLGLKISGSVGIAIYPNDGLNYKDLFDKADKALYMAKKNGKSTYCFFDQHVETVKLRDSVNAMIPAGKNIPEEVSRERTQNKFGIAEQIFTILYESKNMENSVGLIMETIGRHCNVSRVYVFQNAPDGKSAAYTHEWCMEGIRRDIDQINQIDYDIWGNYIQNFNNEGIFYCPDASSLPAEMFEAMRNEGVHAFLECAIYKDGSFAGFVGFDECTGKRLWKKEEIDTLILVSKILGIALRNTIN